MSSAKRVRKALFAPTVAASCVFAILLALGTWQVQRKAWKEGLIAVVTKRFAAPPIRIPPPAEWPRLDPANDEYRRVVLSGEFLNDKEALVFTTGSSLHADEPRPGYWVFTPARLAGGGLVMVNRGFVPEGRQDPATRRAGELSGPIEIVGVMRWPDRPGLFTPAAEPSKNLWFARDPAGMAQAEGLRSIAPFYVEQESPPAPGGLPKVGPLQPSFPNNHLGYALTWYGLALVLAGSFAVWVVGRWRNP